MEDIDIYGQKNFGDEDRPFIYGGGSEDGSGDSEESEESFEFSEDIESREDEADEPGYAAGTYEAERMARGTAAGTKKGERHMTPEERASKTLHFIYDDTRFFKRKDEDAIKYILNRLEHPELYNLRTAILAIEWSKKKAKPKELSRFAEEMSSKEDRIKVHPLDILRYMMILGKTI
jgi:hypothetical protein